MPLESALVIFQPWTEFHVMDSLLKISRSFHIDSCSAYPLCVTNAHTTHTHTQTKIHNPASFYYTSITKPTSGKKWCAIPESVLYTVMGILSSWDLTASPWPTRSFVKVHVYCGWCWWGETLSHHMHCPSNADSFVQPWLRSHVRSLSRLYSATQSASRWSTLTYRQLLNRSPGMFWKNTANARESCICSVMTDIIKQFSLCCNWFNVGRISLLSAHMPAYFLQTAYILTPVVLLWPHV